MNKKGFTLIELCISVALLSVVMIFLLQFLSYIKREDTGIEDETALILNKAIVSKTLNEEFSKMGSLQEVVCKNNLCNIKFMNDKDAELKISDNILLFKDITDDKIIIKREMPVSYDIYYDEKETVDIIILKDPYNSENDIEIVSRKS